MTNIERMLADGWSVRYHEGNRMTLEREGWMAMINVAADTGSIFDPAGVSVKFPETYSWEGLLKGRWYCKSCFKTADMLDTVAMVKDLCIPCLMAEKEAMR